MELQGHILIPEFYSSALISPHVYKWCKTSTVVFSQYKINFCFMEKLYFISTQTAHLFLQTIAKIKINYKISKVGKLCQ